jgi:hypothetical protein
MRNHYWSCSKFADWLRGTPKGGAKTSDDWEAWRKLAQSTHRVRYWLAEEGLDHAQKFFYGPADLLYSIKYYVNNRFITRTHSLTAHPRDIKPGQWSDVGNRFLPCLFNELVDFVEVELAWWHIAWDDEGKAKYKAPFWSKGWWRVRTWRCRQAGLDNLDWQMKLTLDREYPDQDIPADKIGVPTSQAIRAREILDLYMWWTEVRPNRVDPYEASGWTEYCAKMRELNDGSLFGSKTTPELKKLSNRSHKLLQKIEAQYEKEDTDMMIRLIKVRDALWT